MTSREAFCAVLSNGPLIRGDAIVVLSGDGNTRLEVGMEQLKQRAAHNVVVSGGVDAPPHSLTAHAMRAWLIENGLAPDRIIKESESQHTHEQAENVVAMAIEKEWTRLLLVASPYHQYRAYLTFLHVLIAQDKHDTIHLLSVPATQTKWWGTPDGLEFPTDELEWSAKRIDLLEREFEKIDEHRKKGHVAGYKEGLRYLEFWEGK